MYEAHSRSTSTLSERPVAHSQADRSTFYLRPRSCQQRPRLSKAERRSQLKRSRKTTARAESRLHEELKQWYALALGGRREQTVEGFQVDVLKDDLAVEVQVAKLGALEEKVRELSSLGYKVQVVLPIQAVLTSPVKPRASGRSYLRTRRRNASFLDAFRELVHFPEILSLSGVRLEVLLLHEQRVHHAVRHTVWRRGRPRSMLLDGFNRDTTIVEVLDRRVIEQKADLMKLLPTGLPSFFTNHDLAKTASIPYGLASMVTYTLTRLGALRRAGREGRRNLYAFQPL